MDLARTSGCGDAKTEQNDKKATGRGDTDRLLTRGKLRRVGHREEGGRDEETEASLLVDVSPPDAPNAMNPKAGSGMQQARRPGAEKAVEVVRNHEDGTCETPGRVSPKDTNRSMFASGRRESRGSLSPEGE